MQGKFLALILIFSGGLIAYLGDKIGMKVGKNRLSIFGLRPKHTSIIITILSGVLISVLTISFLAVASQNVRIALFEIEDLLEEKEQLTLQVSKRERQLNNLSYNLNLFNNKRDYLANDNKIYAKDQAIESLLIAGEKREVVAKLESLFYAAYWELNQQGIKQQDIFSAKELITDAAAVIKDSGAEYLVSIVATEDIYYGSQVELYFKIHKIN